MVFLDPDIFRSYDIRGIVDKNFSPDVVYFVARALGGEAKRRGQSQIVVAADGRLSSPVLKKKMISGLIDSGIDIIDIGFVPTPLLYFATHTLASRSGVMLTGSHNPPEYNGMKIVIDRDALAEEGLQNLRRAIEHNNFTDSKPGGVIQTDIVSSYINCVIADIVLSKKLKVVVDCGNGIAGEVAPNLFRALGCDVVPLYCEIDGCFPNHHPDPADFTNMRDLSALVVAEKADVGIAFDGDGDRIGVVTNTGRMIRADYLLLLMIKDILSHNPGAHVLYDVKCTSKLQYWVAKLGGQAQMIKTGHSHLRSAIKNTGALLGGELSGHICFNDRWYGFDDAIYAAARLLEIVSRDSIELDMLFACFGEYESTPELKIMTTDSRKFQIMQDLHARADFSGAKIDLTDGIRVEYEQGWGLVRASNTGPVLTLRFEAWDTEELQRIMTIFKQQLRLLAPDLDLMELS